MKSYKIKCEVSEPVLINCWKHHAGFIRSKINEYKNNPKTDLNNLRREIVLIGESLMDLYLGELSPDEIAYSIINFSKQQKILNRTIFEAWLKKEGNDYRIIELQDKSKWTLRLGEKEERYIHIHPSRYSPHTLRVRSASLKSAILFRVLEKNYSDDMLININIIRKEYLNLSPLKNLKPGSSVFKLIDVLT